MGIRLPPQNTKFIHRAFNAQWKRNACERMTFILRYSPSILATITSAENNDIIEERTDVRDGTRPARPKTAGAVNDGDTAEGRF